MCDIIVLLSLGSEEGPEIIRVLLVYKHFISLHTKWLLQEQDVSQGPNFLLEKSGPFPILPAYRATLQIVSITFTELV